jgi:hypothetical protein
MRLLRIRGHIVAVVDAQRAASRRKAGQPRRGLPVMQLICGLLGHRPSPLRALVARKARPAPCIYCQQPLVRRQWSRWEVADDGKAA